jgi:hypothetical protein
MLSFRLALVTVAAGFCLWGLFSLLDSLKEPGLLRSAKATVVKGCDVMNDPQSQQLCPPLLCQKALIDSRVLPYQSEFRIDVDEARGALRLIAGSADAGQFLCVTRAKEVLLARTSDAAEIEAARDSEDWIELIPGESS